MSKKNQFSVTFTNDEKLFDIKTNSQFDSLDLKLIQVQLENIPSDLILESLRLRFLKKIEEGKLDPNSL